jgi:hypothetical protein
MTSFSISNSGQLTQKVDSKVLRVTFREYISYQI